MRLNRDRRIVCATEWFLHVFFFVLYYTDYTAFTWFYDVAKWIKVLVQTDVIFLVKLFTRCVSMNRCSNRVPPGCVDPMAWTRRLRLFQKTEICDRKLLNLLNVHDKFMTENTSCWMLLAFPLCFSGSPEHLGKTSARPSRHSVPSTKSCWMSRCRNSAQRHKVGRTLAELCSTEKSPKDEVFSRWGV